VRISIVSRIRSLTVAALIVNMDQVAAQSDSVTKGRLGFEIGATFKPCEDIEVGRAGVDP
jgi:hypothetical protein